MPPRTIQVNPDTPGTSLEFVMPNNVRMDVQSVLANIDTSGSGAATATLEVIDSSGVVIARKRQAETVTAGVSNGSATWALRLDGDSAAAGGSGYATVQDEGVPLTQRSVLNFVGTGVTAVDQPVPGRTVVTIPGPVAPAIGSYNGPFLALPAAPGFANNALLPWFSPGAADPYLNVAAPGATVLTFKLAGLYLVAATVIQAGQAAGSGFDVIPSFGTAPNWQGHGSVVTMLDAAQGVTVGELTVTGFARTAVGGALQVFCEHMAPAGAAVAQFRIFRCDVVRLGA